MGTLSLDDILITPLIMIESDAGDVMHAMKHDGPGYAGFGEAYFSWIQAGAVKAWKRHARMTMNIIVPVGNIRFIFSVDRTREFRVEEIGTNRYVRLTVPPGIWFGFQGLGQSKSLLLNLGNIIHDETEVERIGMKEINFDWNFL